MTPRRRAAVADARFTERWVRRDRNRRLSRHEIRKFLLARCSVQVVALIGSVRFRFTMRLYGAGSVRDTPPTRLPDSTGRMSCRYSELLHGEPASDRYTIQSVIGAWRVFII